MVDEMNTDPFAAMEATMSEAYDAADADVDEHETPVDETQDTPDTAADDAGDPVAEDDETQGASDDAADEGEGDDQESDDDDGAEAGDDASLSPPSRWSAADKEAFSALPREAQELVLKREGDIERHLTQKSQEIAEDRKRLGVVADLMEKRREAWALEGMAPDQAISQLMSLSDYAGRDPRGFISWFAQQHGLDLTQPDAGADDGFSDPQIQSLKAEIEQLKAMETQRTQQQFNTQRQTIQQAIQAFAEDAQNAPYFAEVQEDIAAMMPAVRQANPNAGPKEWLKIAYDKAVWANEATRAKELERQMQAKEVARRSDAKKAAGKARRVAGTNVRGAPGSIDSEEKLSFDETIARAYDEAIRRAS